MSSCSSQLAAINATLQAVQHHLDTCLVDVDTLNSTAAADDSSSSCSGDFGSYTLGKHVMALFVVLAASFIGTVIPLLERYNPIFRVHPFVIVCGKCLAAGVVLAVALIHMLQPSTNSLTSSCLPTSFTDSYGAYSYLFALAGALLMQFIDTIMELVIRKQYEVVEAAITMQQAPGETAEGSLVPITPAGVVAEDDNEGAGEQLVDHEANEDQAQHRYSSHPSMRSSHHTALVMSDVGVAEMPPAAPAQAPAATPVIANADAPESTGQIIAHHHHSHMMSKDEASNPVKRLLAAAMMEFGVTIHSVFVGLAVGIVSDQELTGLLTALSFHQLFEGLALGSRLSEADFRRSLESILALIFSTSAPVGMAVGIVLIATNGLNANSTTFLLVQGVFDGFCAGILLFLGFGLLFNDFPSDMVKHCDRSCVSYPALRRAGMFTCLWIGAGVMAFIGKYL